MTRRRVVLLAATLAAALVAGLAAPAQAAEPSVGADVSRFQCGRPWAGSQAFTVVAVNTGVPTGTNPCLAEQLALAAGSTGAGHPRTSVYVGTANPDPAQASWWPSSDRSRRGATVRTPYGRCTGGASAACSFVYGASLALDDLQTRGVPAGAAARWWLDVEAANSWSSSTERNRAVLEGMTTRFTLAGERVGLYALSHEFRDLIGPVPSGSPLRPLPSWLAGAADQAHAGEVCAREPLAGGRVLLAQWVRVAGTDRLDLDLACTRLPEQPKPRVTGAKRVGATLTAKPGARGDGVRLQRRWLRDGEPIDGAEQATYTVRKKDAGHRIAVEATATRDGSSRVRRTSAGVRIPR